MQQQLPPYNHCWCLSFYGTSNQETTHTTFQESVSISLQTAAESAASSWRISNFENTKESWSLLINFTSCFTNFKNFFFPQMKTQLVLEHYCVPGLHNKSTKKNNTSSDLYHHFWLSFKKMNADTLGNVMWRIIYSDTVLTSRFYFEICKSSL